MRVGRAITLWMGVCLGSLAAQDCPPVARVLPNGTLAGALDAASCQLGDRTPYCAYRLDLPVRGQIKIELSGNTGDFSLTLRDASGIRLDSGTGLLRPIEAGSLHSAGERPNARPDRQFHRDHFVHQRTRHALREFSQYRTQPDRRGKTPGFRLSGSRRHSVRGLYADYGRRRHAHGDGRERGLHARDRGSLDRRAAPFPCPRPAR